jgi:hypothetical protein
VTTPAPAGPGAAAVLARQQPVTRQPSPAGKDDTHCQPRTTAQPPATPAQWLVFGGWAFDMTATARAAILRDPPSETASLPVAPWARTYGLDRDPGSDTATIPLLGPGPGFNRAYAMTTDLTQPVIIATLPVTGDEPASPRTRSPPSTTPPLPRGRDTGSPVPAAAPAITVGRRHGRRRRDHPHRCLRRVRPPARGTFTPVRVHEYGTHPIE